MSNYPAWWNETITLYNCYRYKDENTNKTTTKWLNIVISGCSYTCSRNQVFGNDSVILANAFTVRIRKNDKYKEPTEYYKLPVNTLGNYFTLNKGDIIVKGSVDDVIPDNNSGSALLDKYKDDCFIIKTAKNNAKLKRTAHYLGSDK